MRIFTKTTCLIQFLLFAALIGGASSCKKPEPPKKVSTNATTPFEVGQVWAYRSRPGEEKSQFVICKIEDDPKFGRLVHIAVAGLKMRNLRSPSGISDNIPHMPFQEAAVRASVVELIGTTTTLPPYESGYEQWKSAKEAGQGGVWTIPIGQVISEMEFQFTHVLPAPATMPASTPAQDQAGNAPATMPATVPTL